MFAWLGLACALLITPPARATGTFSIVGRDMWVRVDRVYDGDTFRTTDGRRIRLLGINAPEIAHGTERGEPWGRQARVALIKLIRGRAVRLRLDVQHYDIYGRLLAQVYRRDGRWVNGELVRNGYAFVYTFPPNTRWAPALLRLEQQARGKKLGIWRLPRFRVLRAARVGRRNIGQFRLVEGRVSHPNASGFGFRLGVIHVSVPRKYRPYFKAVPRVQAGQHVIVHGTIRISDGKLYLALHSPCDLEVVR